MWLLQVVRKAYIVMAMQKKDRENKKLTTFSIEPSAKEELSRLFEDMGLTWSSGIRMALKEFVKKHREG